MDDGFGVMVEFLHKAGQKAEALMAENAQDSFDGQGLIDMGCCDDAALVFAMPF